MIYLSSDLHFLHNKEFIYKPRGFSSIKEMDNTIIKNWNEIIKPEDDVYVLGDLALGGPTALSDALILIKMLNGKLHLVRGNHDTDNRWEAYKTLPNVIEAQNAIYLKYRGYHLYMSHFPTMTANLEKESLKQCTINLYGHTHQKTNFYEDIPFMYHVGLDSHYCKPVALDKAISEMEEQVRTCKQELEDTITRITDLFSSLNELTNKKN